jgi:DNA-binding MarR family transcriptional regulator
MSDATKSTRELHLLQEIERDPDATQANLAHLLGVAVGTVNWHIKRLVAKGYVKVKRAERKKLRYIITPEGIALRAKLTIGYIERSLSLYREARSDAKKAVQEARKLGYESVHLRGEGEIAEICRLTCMDMGMPIVEASVDGRGAALNIEGLRISLLVAEQDR